MVVSKYCLRKKIDEVQLSKVAKVEKSAAYNFFPAYRSVMMTAFIVMYKSMSCFAYFAGQASETSPTEIPKKVGYWFQWISGISTASFSVEHSAGLVNPVDSKKPVKPGVCGGNPVKEKATERTLKFVEIVYPHSRGLKRREPEGVKYRMQQWYSP